jgi:outer membrane protein TolC
MVGCSELLGSRVDFGASHGTYSLLAGVRFPIYAGGWVHTDIDQAEAMLRNKKNALEDLRGRIDYEVRNALLDLQGVPQYLNLKP